MSQSFFEPVHQVHWPSVHRVLANGCCSRVLPTIGECRKLEEFVAYWDALDYIVRCVLGWADPSTGLRWWYAEGCKLTGDPWLDLITRHWNDEGQLAFYAAHLWRGLNTGLEQEPLSWETMTQQASAGDLQWWTDFHRMGRPWPFDPFYGGTNPMHLGMAETVEEANPPGKWEGYRCDRLAEERKAVLITSAFLRWPAELAAFGETLPDDPHHSWHVDVFDREFGWLGLFRKSRVTGRWFQGRHSVHMAGNPVE